MQGTRCTTPDEYVPVDEGLVYGSHGISASQRSQPRNRKAFEQGIWNSIYRRHAMPLEKDTEGVPSSNLEPEARPLLSSIRWPENEAHPQTRPNVANIP
jgi:hypothetical protein